MNTFAYIGFQQVNYSIYYAPYSLSKATALILVKQKVMPLLKGMITPEQNTKCYISWPPT